MDGLVSERNCQYLLICERCADCHGRLVNTGPRVGLSTGLVWGRSACRSLEPVRGRWDCSWFEPARTTGRPNLFESHRALTKTGAVRVRWGREQLIGGKPERLVSRVLRVPVRVLDPMEHPN